MRLTNLLHLLLTILLRQLSLTILCLRLLRILILLRLTILVGLLLTVLCLRCHSIPCYSLRLLPVNPKPTLLLSYTLLLLPKGIQLCVALCLR